MPYRLNIDTATFAPACLDADLGAGLSILWAIERVALLLDHMQRMHLHHSQEQRAMPEQAIDKEHM